MNKKSMHKTKNDRKYMTEIYELLSAIGLFGNTAVLVVFRNIWTYEELPEWDFRPTPKSSYLTIMQYNPIFAIIYILCGGILLFCGMNKLVNYVNVKKNRKSLIFENKKCQSALKYSFINNSILLKTSTIEKNEFHEVWRQQTNDHSIQILCFNEKTGEFKAFDRFHWMNEPIYNGFAGDYEYEKDLWTPIKLHYTTEWLKEHLIDIN